MAVAYRSVGTQATRNSSASLSVGLPTGHAGNDILLILACNFKSGGGSDILNTPSGWTALNKKVGWGASPNRTAYAFHKIDSGSESAASLDTGGVTSSLQAVMVAFSGGDTTTPVEAQSAWGNNDTGTNITVPALTSLTNNALLVTMMEDGDGATPTTPPAGATQKFTTSFFVAVFALATETKATAGTEAADVYVRGSTGVDGATILQIALRESGATVPSGFVPRITIIE